MAKKKQLTIGALKKEAKKYNEQFTEEINGYEVKIDKEFSPTKINALIVELLETYQKTVNKSSSISSIFIPYAMLLCIKYFTSVDIPNALEEQLQVLELLIDSGFLNPIIEALPQDQLDLVFQQIERQTAKMNEIMDEFEARMAEFEIKNPEVAKRLKGEA